MIHPSLEHPEYEENIAKLKKKGYRSPEPGDLPAYLDGYCGAERFLVTDGGDIKAVSQIDGEIRDVPKVPPEDRETPRPRPKTQPIS